MRTRLQTLYLVGLRAIGGLACIAGVLALASVPQSLSEDLFIKVPAIFAGLTLLVSMVLLVPKFTPRWLSHPKGGFVGFGVSMLFAVLPFFLMMTMFASALVFGFGLEHPATKSIAIGMNLTSFGLCGLMWVLALTLSIWPEAGGTPPSHNGQTDLPPIPRKKVDIRALRKARTA